MARKCTRCGSLGPFRLIRRRHLNGWVEQESARCGPCESAAGVERARRLRARRKAA